MADRQADRAHPNRLCQQALVAYMSDANKEISPEFARRLRERDLSPTLFGPHDLRAIAQTGLEAEIAQISPGMNSTDVVAEALRRRGKGYANEHISQLITDRDRYASIASECVKKALDQAAPQAARLILSGQLTPKSDLRVRLTENLLGSGTGQ